MPIATNTQEAAQFRATAGQVQGFGPTPRVALDALLTHGVDVFKTPIVIWPFNRGDAFFSDTQRARLQELKDRGSLRSQEEQDELEKLIEDSFDATIARTETLQQRKP